MSGWGELLQLRNPVTRAWPRCRPAARSPGRRAAFNDFAEVVLTVAFLVRELMTSPVSDRWPRLAH